MRRTVLGLMVAVALLAGAPSGRAQEQPVPERKLVFNFREASVDAVLQFVCRQLNWTLVYSAKPEGTITAFSDSEIVEGKVVDFLNTALAKTRCQVFQYGGVLKVVSEEEARKGTFNIEYGDDPAKIPINDTVRTWIIPLKNANVADVNKELKDVLTSEGLAMAINTYSNTIVVTGKSSAIYRVARILKIIDVQATDRLIVKSFRLKNADATETAKLLNEIFKREASMPSQGGQNPWRQVAQAFGMGGRGGGDQGPMARTLASETLRITADVRTNSIVAAATPENLKIIEDLVAQLDGQGAEAVRLKLYPLRYADAKEVATMITSIFAEAATQQGGRNQGGGGPRWMGGPPQMPAATETTGASREVKAVADVRSNAVVVAGNEGNLRIIDDLIANVDRQVTDILRIKVYELKNGDAQQMTNMLREMFRPQINATQQAGRTQGNQPQQGGQFGNRSGGGAGSGALPPSMEMEIAADTRTNSIVVKASESFLEIVDQIVSQLDRNPTESMSTYVLDLKNGTAADIAQVLQNLLRGGTGTTNRNTGGTTGNRNTGNNRAGSTRTGGGGATRNLGPLQDGPAPSQDPPPQDQEEEDRRGITGQVDVQADPATNSLVIRTSPRNFEAIRNIVANLDRMRPQVLIKVLIAEVTLDKSTQFGVEGFWENKFRVHGDSITHRYGTEFDLPSKGLAILGSGDELQLKLNAFADEGKLKVLATPRVMVLDNETANINVGKEVPRVTNSTVNQQGNVVNTVTYENVGILLEVTPKINLDGLVTLEVRPEISDIAPASESVTITEGVTSPTFFVNSAETTVAARHGQTVVIGGLIRDSVTDTLQKVPVLGDIPILGWLFSNTTKETVKRELMIFLTPYVAFTPGQVEELTELEKSKLKLIDDRDIESEGDRWLERIRK